MAKKNSLKRRKEQHKFLVQKEKEEDEKRKKKMELKKEKRKRKREEEEEAFLKGDGEMKEAKESKQRRRFLRGKRKRHGKIINYQMPPTEDTGDASLIPSGKKRRKSKIQKMDVEAIHTPTLPPETIETNNVAFINSLVDMDLELPSQPTKKSRKL